jgi:nucleoid DNA-binding protein
MPAKGFKELVLIPALREQGLTVREASAVVDAIFDSIKEALLRHEEVELPIGNFTVELNPHENGQRFGKLVTFAKYRLDFLPSVELKLAVASAPPSPPPPKRKKKPTEIKPIKIESIKTEPIESAPTQSELTIATELIVDFVRSNVQPGNWKLFFDELRAGASRSVAAIFKRARPQPHELRPLSEAAQVIEECAPQQMPEDSWDHLYACLEWFARWSRRVIPKEVWQQAMEQARKTFLPQDFIPTLDGR